MSKLTLGRREVNGWECGGTTGSPHKGDHICVDNKIEAAEDNVFAVQDWHHINVDNKIGRRGSRGCIYRIRFTPEKSLWAPESSAESLRKWRFLFPKANWLAYLQLARRHDTVKLFLANETTAMPGSFNRKLRHVPSWSKCTSPRVSIKRAQELTYKCFPHDIHCPK